MIHNDLKKNGFSLLELLVVVALIGIIALFTVPNINSWSEARKAEKDLSEIIKLIDRSKSTNPAKIYFSFKIGRLFKVQLSYFI